MQNKKILFITHRYPKGENTILEKDTIKSFFNKGYDVTVIAPIERRCLEKTHIYNDNGIEVLYVKTGNNFNDTSRLEKLITILIRPYLIKKAIEKYYLNKKFDIIFGYTPFMANYKLFLSLKNKYNSKLILFLWDIFPQNGKDLGMFKNKVIFKFLKFREKMMYKIFDKIICNCEGQIEYIFENKYKEKKDIILIRNSEQDKKIEKLKKDDKKRIKKELGYKKYEIISIFGGNMGEPQELDNIMNMIFNLKKFEYLKFIFVGDGTQKNKLKRIKREKKLENLEILDFIEREKYENILKISDVGLISLNKNYTVPNFPAKVTGYIKQEIPIFASLDKCSLKYLGKFIEKNEVGIAAEAGDLKEMEEKFLKLVKDLKKYKKENFRKVYLNNFNINKITELLEKRMED